MSELNVTIQGQAYKLSCRIGEEKMLHDAVSYLNSKLNTIRDGGKVRGNDRIAVMAAISIAAELLAMKSPQGPFSDMTMAEVKQQMEEMHAVLDQALTPQEDLF
ncbi:cell division protein ZapA [Massilia sp. W12]|uniref:cell division protein ZapA n=1 Tax=Massilia sp. W12 TaxID=3126507 RepID=UPI0030CC958E